MSPDSCACDTKVLLIGVCRPPDTEFRRPATALSEWRPNEQGFNPTLPGTLGDTPPPHHTKNKTRNETHNTYTVYMCASKNGAWPVWREPRKDRSTALECIHHAAVCQPRLNWMLAPEASDGTVDHKSAVPLEPSIATCQFYFPVLLGFSRILRHPMLLTS